MNKIKGKLFKYPLALLVAIFVVMAVAVSLSELKSHIIDNARHNLTTVNKNVRLALHRQIETEVIAINQMIENNETRKTLMQVLKTGASSQGQRFGLRKVLSESVFSQHYNGYYLIALNKQIIASMKESDSGLMAPQSAVAAIQRLEQGEQSAITHAFSYNGKISMWLLKGITDDRGKSVAYFALDLGEKNRFSSTTLSAGLTYATGETYLVDAQGRMLSEARFHDDLVKAGLLKVGEYSTLNINVRDPGLNLLEQQKRHIVSSEAPFTLALTQVLAEPELSWNMDGYRDYRGVPVLGVWQWDKYLKAAIITEIDQEEAMQQYRYVRNLLLILMLIVVAGTILAVMAYSRMRIRSEKEANRHKDLLLKSTAEAIFGIDLNGDCTFVNLSFLNMLGYKEKEVIGKNIHQLIHHTYSNGDAYPIEDCNIYKAHREKTRVHSCEESFWHKDGSQILVEYWSQPLFEGDDAVGSVVTFLDITQQRQNEFEREQLEKQVQHSQRLESLGVLAGGIAHDFNNLLAAILGNASLVESNILKDPLKAKERASKIILSAEKAGVLCKQMLAYSGKGQFILKPIDLSEIVEEMTHLLEVSIDKAVILKYHLAKHLPLIMVDEAQIQQVVMNLVTNANEAIDGRSGVVSVTTGMMHADKHYLATCHAEKIQAGRFIYVEVSDTGCGMDRETIQKVFDPFFTTKVTGRGLGMSAVLGIVRGHKGALKVYSEPGRGTTFKFLLPIDESETSRSIGEPHDNSVQHYTGGVVLVVDDEETVREVTCMMLEEMGFETITAANGEDGLALYKKHRNSILFVFTDLTMPRMCGKELFTNLKRINPECRVILSSGYNSTEAIQQFSGKGLAGFVQKPFTPHALSEEVKKILGAGE